MAVTTFPDAPSFADAVIPAPPVRKEGEDIDAYINKLTGFLQGQYLTLVDMQGSIASGWLIDTVRILNLEAGTITSDSIFTQDLFIGADGNGSIELSGTTTQIIVVDEAGTQRVIIGDLGAGTTNWGIRVADASGVVKFESSTTTFIDGAIISNATITNSKIVDLNGTKLTDGTVGNAKISDLSASKITVSGTLTCTSSTTAINVTSAGVVTFSGGGDIIMKASAAGDTNFISFRTSANSARANLTYSVSADTFYAVATGGAKATFGSDADDVDLIAGSGSQLQMAVSGGAILTMGANITLSPGTVTVSAGNFRPDTDSSRDCGTTSIRWANGWFDLVNGADICLDNGCRFTEPDKVYVDADALDGVLIMNSMWECIAWFHRNGDIEVRGEVRARQAFPVPTVARRESGESIH